MGIIPDFADHEGLTVEPEDGSEAVVDAQTRDRIRRLARAAEAIHSLTYYSAEINTMTADGFRGWWHTYFAYRPSPMGAVNAGVVTAAFYNFAPEFVARAVPGVWSIMGPEEANHRRQVLVGQAVERIFAKHELAETLTEARGLAKQAVAELLPEGRPLFAAYADLTWPSESGSEGVASVFEDDVVLAGLDLWHACTLLREFRGDTHNVVLAASGIDGCECHVLMAANGYGNQPTITGIRGWTAPQWQAAVKRLEGRGLVTSDGSYTEQGHTMRRSIEGHTDILSSQPIHSLGSERSDILLEALELLADHLTSNGDVAGVWPPPATIKSV